MQGPPAFLALRQRSGVLPMPAVDLIADPTAPLVQHGAADQVGTGSGFVGPDIPAALTVVVVSYNSADHLDELLTSLQAEAEMHALRVVVVDNGSTDATIARASSYPGVAVVQAPGNLGYAGGVNIGARYAGARTNSAASPQP